MFRAHLGGRTRLFISSVAREEETAGNETNEVSRRALNNRRIDISFAEIGSDIVTRVATSDNNSLLSFPSFSGATRVTRRMRNDSLEIIHREIGVSRFTREARSEDQVVDLEGTIFSDLAVDLDRPSLRLSIVFRVSFDRRLEPDVQLHHLRIMLHEVGQLRG